MNKKEKEERLKEITSLIHKLNDNMKNKRIKKQYYMYTTIELLEEGIKLTSNFKQKVHLKMQLKLIKQMAGFFEKGGLM